jgi:hypothetical protein
VRVTGVARVIDGTQRSEAIAKLAAMNFNEENACFIGL